MVAPQGGLYGLLRLVSHIAVFLGGIFHQLSLSETYVQDFITYQNSPGEPLLNVSSSFCSTLAVFVI